METTPQTAALAARIRAARESCGLNKSELARAMGTTHVTVGNWERGTHEIKLSDALLFCSVTGQTLDWLAYGIGEMNMAPTVSGEGQESRLRDLNPRPVLYKGDDLAGMAGLAGTERAHLC